MAYDIVSMNVAIPMKLADLDTTLTGVQTLIAMYALAMAASRNQHASGRVLRT